jgi:hypothetical protein
VKEKEKRETIDDIYFVDDGIDWYIHHAFFLFFK